MVVIVVIIICFTHLIIDCYVSNPTQIPVLNSTEVNNNNDERKQGPAAFPARKQGRTSCHGHHQWLDQPLLLEQNHTLFLI